MRIAVLKKDKCVAPENCNYLCVNVCPINRTGKECITIDEGGKPRISEELCIGCDICVKKCPGEAISIVNLPEELDSQAIHRYSENGFKLFRTIIPRNGVVGVIGRNGIGKTTMVSILSGKLYPNLGKPGYKPTKKEILDFFQGSEVRNYMDDLFEGKIKVSIKPQYIELIPKNFKGTVKELFNENVPDSLKVIENRKLDELSGGELQRVAIEYAIQKPHDIIFVDEPSSYLDIKQRIEVAKKIRSLSGKVVVVEHDLIMLDYMVDYIHILYGKPGVYGIVSHQMATRNGINSYLDGYIKDDNVRFRDKKVKFEIKSAERDISNEILVSFGKIKKKLGTFSLEVSPGELMKKEIVGVVGENGTGKSTFAKILAGVLNPDEGEINEKIKIAYKPQYIRVESEEFVRNVLPKIDNRIIQALGVRLNKRLNELSGGELQRVAIAKTLLTDADLYVLDEPSAHLDVEERLVLSKLLRDFIFENEKTIFVIDHDIMFIDYVSDRLMVFQGKPGVKGVTYGPLPMREGMNLFLKNLGITMRRDKQTNRPRINKEGSVLDREQKEKGEYYY